ncbi:hypothetical protein FA13DRAFT_161899 [Coprinellus micaceus]|uniref:Uncharacterized protein n=1 Tax=Coprinellus micaceus TaxID=71717 RepID=A0A4Y7THW4_COPMI|nr:hypothetical protein FA13DRAFT_161899 [Coprinellus micaceus]
MPEFLPRYQLHSSAYKSVKSSGASGRPRHDVLMYFNTTVYQDHVAFITSAIQCISAPSYSLVSSCSLRVRHSSLFQTALLIQLSPVHSVPLNDGFAYPRTTSLEFPSPSLQSTSPKRTRGPSLTSFDRPLCLPSANQRPWHAIRHIDSRSTNWVAS